MLGERLRSGSDEEIFTFRLPKALLPGFHELVLRACSEREGDMDRLPLSSVPVAPRKRRVSQLAVWSS